MSDTTGLVKRQSQNTEKKSSENRHFFTLGPILGGFPDWVRVVSYPVGTASSLASRICPKYVDTTGSWCARAKILKVGLQKWPFLDQFWIFGAQNGPGWVWKHQKWIQHPKKPLVRHLTHLWTPSGGETAKKRLSDYSRLPDYRRLPSLKGGGGGGYTIMLCRRWLILAAFNLYDYHWLHYYLDFLFLGFIFFL